MLILCTRTHTLEKGPQPTKETNSKIRTISGTGAAEYKPEDLKQSRER